MFGAVEAQPRNANDLLADTLRNTLGMRTACFRTGAIPGQSGGVPQRPDIGFRKATLPKRTLMSTFAVPSGLGGQNDWEYNSKGYYRGVRMLVSGTETTATGDPVDKIGDFPYDLANRIQMRDSAGGMAFSLKGASAYFQRRYFQPAMGRDPQQSGDTRVYRANIQVIQANNINFSWDIALETGTRDAIGAAPNQNASFKYTLTLNVDSTANLFTTAANWSASALTVQPSMRYYTVPAGVRSDGKTQATQPPFPGVLRQIFDQTLTVSQAAESPYNFTTGHVKRQMIFVARASAAGARQGNLSRFKLLYGDDNILFDSTEQDLIEECFKLYGETPPTGVYPVTFSADNDGFVGADYRRDNLDTRRLSNLYALLTFAGSFGTGAVDVIHDDLLVPISMPW